MCFLPLPLLLSNACKRRGKKVVCFYRKYVHVNFKGVCIYVCFRTASHIRSANNENPTERASLLAFEMMKVYFAQRAIFGGSCKGMGGAAALICHQLCAFNSGFVQIIGQIRFHRIYIKTANRHTERIKMI